MEKDRIHEIKKRGYANINNKLFIVKK